MRKKIALTLAVLAFICACASVAGTGRRQLSLYSDEEINEMSYAAYKSDVVESGKLSTNKAQVDMIRRVGERVAKAAELYMKEHGREADLANFNWEFNLIEAPDTVNAFCMPGGKVAFYTGILPICGTEAGVAVVMGHEVAHALAKHGNERVSQQAAAGALQSLIGSYKGEVMSTVFGLGANMGVLLPCSRKHESEADGFGFYLRAIAGYDPEEAVGFWGRMAALSGQEGSSLDQFLSTHPADKKRIADLEKLMPKAEDYYKNSVMR
mgnify:CR=1 FL=1